MLAFAVFGSLIIFSAMYLGFGLECMVCNTDGDSTDDTSACNRTEGKQVNCTVDDLIADQIRAIEVAAYGALDLQNISYFGSSARQDTITKLTSKARSNLQTVMLEKIGGDDKTREKNLVCLKVVLKDGDRKTVFIRRSCAAKSSSGEDPCDSKMAKEEYKRTLQTLRWSKHIDIEECETCVGEKCNAAIEITPNFWIYPTPFLLIAVASKLLF